MIKKILNNSFARNSLILFAGSMAVNALNYVFHLALGRIVSVEVYGEVESLLSLMAIISVPSVAIGMVATKFSAAHKADNDPQGNYGIFKYLNKKVFFWGFPAFLSLVILTPYVGRFLRIDNNLSLVLIWISMFLSFFLSISGGLISGWQKFKEANWMNISGAVAKLIFAIILIRIGFALNGAVGGYVLGVLVSYVVSLIYIRFILVAKNGKSDKKDKLYFSSVKRYIMPAFIGTLAINILGNADMVLAKHNLDAVSAGQYGALTIVSRIIFFFTSIITTVLFSMSAENSHKKTDSSVILKQAAYLMFFISVAAVTAYFLFPTFILSLLFGDRYDNVADYLGWFSISAVLYSFVNLFFQYLMSIHKTLAAYVLIIVAGIAVPFIFFFGSDIIAIIAIVSIMQILAMTVCLYFLAASRPKTL